jgi:pimeloyl-ACP methyl ester carboxylesterase
VSVPAEPGALQKFTSQKLAWGDCTPYVTGDESRETFKTTGIDCARLTVPLDYSKPTGDTITLGVLRHRAGKTDQRIGSLVINPGGPGGSGMTAAASTAAKTANGTVGQRFDIVGFDPRGVGASQPTLNCLTDAERDADRADDSETDGSAAGIAKQEAEAKSFGEKCAQRVEHGAAMLANIGTRDVVRDVDILRAVLGDQKLTYLGYSYGTHIGYAYAEAYPGKVRAMVLDGAVDPEQDPVTHVVEQAAAFQKAFDEFAKWCAARQDCALGRDSAGAVKIFQDLFRPLIEKPVAAGTRKLSFEDAGLGTIAALYSRDTWTFLNSALGQLKRGSGESLIKLADYYNERGQDGHYGTIQDVNAAVNCADSPKVTDKARIAEANRRIDEVAPFLDDGKANGAALDVCAFWPVPNTSQPHALDVAAVPQTLVISTTNDPATPYQSGVNLAKDLNGRLLTFEGTQHTVFLQGNSCVDKAGTDYLVDGTLPADGTRCR